MKRETLLNIIAVITWIFTIIFVFTLVTSSLFSRNFHLFLVFSFGGISTIGGLVLFAMEHQSIFKKLFDTTAAKLVAAALTYAVITISMIYTDRFIADTTGVNPSSFDNARNILVLFIAPLFWTLVFYFITIVIYIFQFFHISFSTFKNSRSQVIVRNAAAFVSLLVWLSILAPGLLKIYATKPVEDFLVETLIFSGYLNSDKLCNKLPAKTKIAFLDDNNVSIAELDNKKKWQFREGKCERK